MVKMKNIIVVKPREETAAISEVIQWVRKTSLLDETLTDSHFTQTVLTTNRVKLQRTFSRSTLQDTHTNYKIMPNYYKQLKHS